MKKYLLFLLITLGYISPAISASDTIQRAREQRVKLVELQDELLEMLLDTPFELREYIFPMLNEETSIPKKIKTHPDILAWKGVRPNRVAERFQNDYELLNDLPARYYAFLAPEFWNDAPTSELEANSNQLFATLVPGANSLIPPEELVVTKHILKTIQEHLTPEQRKMIETQSDIYLSALQLDGLEMRQAVSYYGYESLQEFTDFIDTIAKIYRQYTKHTPVLPSEEQKLVANYFMMIPKIFQDTGFNGLLDPQRYSD